MIVVDPSVLMAIVKGEPGAEVYERFLRNRSHDFVMSTASLVEVFVAAERRFEGPGGGHVMLRLCQTFLIEPRPFDVTQLGWAVEAFDRFGKGRARPPAVLNFGDCFTYALAKTLNAPLLFKGEDFAKTDIIAAGVDL